MIDPARQGKARDAIFGPRPCPPKASKPAHDPLVCGIVFEGPPICPGCQAGTPLGPPPDPDGAPGRPAEETARAEPPPACNNNPSYPFVEVLKKNACYTPRVPVYFEPAGPCPTPSPFVHLAPRVPTGPDIAAHLPCKRWNCPCCSPAKKQALVERVHAAAERDGLDRLSCLTCDSRDWGRLRLAIWRAGGKYLTVVAGPERERLLVLSTVPLKGAVPVELTDAIDKLAEALRSVPLTRGRPVNYSTGWLPNVPRKNWCRFAGNIPASGEHFNEMLVAEAAAGRLTSKPIGPGAVVWRFAANVPEEQRDRIRDRLFGHTLPVHGTPRRETSGGTAETAQVV